MIRLGWTGLISFVFAASLFAHEDHSPVPGTLLAPKEYYDAKESEEKLRALAFAHPKLASVIDLNDWLGIEKTHDGNSLFALKVSRNVSKVEDEPKLLFIGQHHARELMTHHAVIDAAADLLQKVVRRDPKALSWVEKTEIWFVPVVNPDGLNYVFEKNAYWRKNRSRNSDGSRGVDLNRNYAFKWGECGSNSSKGSSQVFKGPSPFSEVEARIMDRLNARVLFDYAISYHSSGNEVLFPYTCGELPEEGYYYQLRDELAEELDFGKRVASSSGEDFEHHYAMYGTISFLLEIGTSFQPKFSKYRSTVWPSVQKVLPFMVEEALKPHTTLKVKDSSGLPVKAQLALTEIPFKEGEVRQTDRFGSFRWRLEAGTYQLRVTADGFDPKNVSFEVVEGKHLQVPIELDSAAPVDIVDLVLPQVSASLS